MCVCPINATYQGVKYLNKFLLWFEQFLTPLFIQISINKCWCLIIKTILMWITQIKVFSKEKLSIKLQKQIARKKLMQDSRQSEFYLPCLSNDDQNNRNQEWKTRCDKKTKVSAVWQMISASQDLRRPQRTLRRMKTRMQMKPHTHRSRKKA